MQTEEEAAVECLQQCHMALSDSNPALAFKAAQIAVSLEEKQILAKAFEALLSQPAPLEQYEWKA